MNPAASLPAGLRLRRQSRLRSRTARGDAAAFTALYERHHQELYRFCRSILRHEEDARDAVQNAMTKAFAALQHEDRDFELRPWLFRIAHNEAVTMLRARRPTEDLDAAREAGHDPLPQTLSDRERLAHLRTDLFDLPERQRAALVLRELSGLGHEEIAGALGGTPRSVKQTIFEARAALHECAEGRAMACEPVQRALSDGDGRILKGRRLRAHLRSCASCRSFRHALEQRPGDLAALAPPLPVAAAAAVAAQVLSGAGGAAVGAAGAGSAGAGAVATGAAVTGGGLLAGAGTKAAVVAVVATVAGGATATQVPERDARRDAAPVIRRTVPPSAPATAAPGAARSPAASMPDTRERRGEAASSRTDDGRAQPTSGGRRATSPHEPTAARPAKAARPVQAGARTPRAAERARGGGAADPAASRKRATPPEDGTAAKRGGAPKSPAPASRPPKQQPAAAARPSAAIPERPAKPARIAPDPQPPAALLPPEAKASHANRNPS